MPTLFKRSSLPLWAFVLIIVVGSLCILVTLAFVIRHFIVKKKAGQPSGDEFTAPTRMMTVRRGRVVPQSHYLSLTGSRFGLNELENDAATTRSKSPFEWLNRVNKRNGSGDLSQRGSIFGAPSINTNISTTTAEKGPADWTIHESEPSIPSPALHLALKGSPCPSPSPTNSPIHNTFQRPFRSGTPGSPFAYDHRLSMIEEASPHQSIISTRSRQRSMEVPAARLAGDGSNLLREPHRSSRLGSAHTQLPSPPSYEEHRSSSKHSKSPKSRHGFAQPVSISTNTNSWHDASQLNALPAVDELQQKEWLPQASPSLSGSPSNPPHSFSTTRQQQGQQQRNSSQLSTSSPAVDSRSSFPTRTTSLSKKGKVLRKKSLRNMEIVSKT
ncbi:hypothetical protein DV737_g3144, partial [Chaetothyriales sp. CBS 132003]